MVRALKGRGQTVATAESLTAGLCAATIAGIPGASAVLRGGLIVYATDLKATLAGVPEDVLSAQGPVAADTAAAMARGVAARCGADWGVALTGVAGPDEQDGHPPGTVYIAVVDTGTDTVGVTRHQLTGDRWQIRLLSCTRALDDLLTRLVATGSTDSGRTDAH